MNSRVVVPAALPLGRGSLISESLHLGHASKSLNFPRCDLSHLCRVCVWVCCCAVELKLIPI